MFWWRKSISTGSKAGRFAVRRITWTRAMRGTLTARRAPTKTTRSPTTGPWKFAVRELLIDKGILTAGDVRRQVESWTPAGPGAGAAMVAPRLARSFLQAAHARGRLRSRAGDRP